MKRKLIKFIGVIVLFIVTLVAVFSGPGHSEVMAAGSVNVSFKMYDADKYSLYSKVKKSVDRYDALASKARASYWNGNQLKSKNNSAIACDDNGEGWEDYPYGWWDNYYCEAGTVESVEVTYYDSEYNTLTETLPAGLGYTYDEAKAIVDSFAEQTEFTYGDTVIVEFYVTNTDTLSSLQLGLDFDELGKITSGASVEILLTSPSTSTKYFSTMGAFANTYSAFLFSKSGASDTGLPAGTYLIGYESFTIAEQANCTANSITIDVNHTNPNYWKCLNLTSVSQTTTSTTRTLTITGGATKNDTTSGVGTPTISTATGTTSTGTVASESNSSQTYNSFTTGTIGENDSSVSISIPASSDNSTITGISGVYASVDDAVAGIGSRTGTTSYTGNINTSGISAGDTGYVAIEVTSEDGTNTEIYIIAIPKAESSSNSLDSITFGISGSSYSSLFTSPSLASTMNVEVPSDATSLDLSGITFTGASIVINGTTYTSSTLPSTVNISLTSAPTSFKIRTIAASSTSTNPVYTDYTVNIAYKSIKATITSVTVFYSLNSQSLNVAAVSDTVSMSTYKGAFKNPTDLDYQVGSFKLKAASSDTIGSITGIIASSGATIGDCKNSNSSSVSFSSGVAAETVKVILTVTSQWGNTAEYEVNISREQADTDSNFNGNPTVTDGTNAIAGTWTNSGSNYTFTPSATELDYTVSSFVLSGTLPSTATATYSIYTGTSSTPDDTGTIPANGSVSVNFGTGSAAITKKLVIVVTAEDGSTTSTYTVSLKREEADNDTSVNVYIYDMSNADLNCSYNSSGYYENIVLVPYPTTQAQIKIDVNTATTKVYSGSTDITGITDTYSLTGLTTEYSFKVIPENTSNPLTIKVKIKKVAPDTSTGFTLKISDISGNDLGLSNGGNIYTHTSTIPNATTQVKIELNASKSTTSIHKNSATGADASGEQTYTLNTNNLTTDFIFYIVPEDTTQAISITVRINKQPLNNNTNVHIDAELSDSTTVSLTQSGSDWSNAGDLIPYGTSIIKLKIYTDIATTYVQYQGTTVSDLVAAAVFNNYNLNQTATATTPTTLQFTLFTEANTSGSTFNVKIYSVNPDNTITTNLTVTYNGSNITMSYDTANKVWKNDTKLPFGWNNIKYTISATKSTSSAYIGSTLIDNVEQTLTNQWSSSAYTDNISEQSIIIYTQMYPVSSSGASTITIKIEQEEPSHTSTANVSTIKVTGEGNGIQYTTSDTSSPFSYTVPKALDSATSTTNNGYYCINITATDSNATIYYSQNINNLKENLLTSTTALPIGNFGNPSIVYVTIYAEDENTYTTYTFKVQDVDTRSNDAKISDITINETLADGTTFQFLQTKDTYNIYFDYSVNNINITATKNDSTAQWISTSTTNGGVNISAATSTTPVKLTYQLKAANGSLGTLYTINVYKNDPDTDNTIDTLEINGDAYTFDSANNLDVVVSRNQSTAYFDFTLTSSKAKSYTTSGTIFNNSTAKQGTVNLVQGGVVNIKIVVKSEKDIADGSTGRTYNIYIYAAEQTFELDNVEINNYGTGDALKDTDGNTFVFDGTKVAPTIQKMTVPYGSASVVAEVIANLKTNSSNAHVTITNNGISNLVLGVGGTTFTIVVKSEYAYLNSSITDQSVTYIINIVREDPSYDATLKELKVSIDGVDVAFTNKAFSPSDVGPYTIENVSDSAANIVITAVANDKNATVIGTGTHQLTLVSYSSNNFTVKVTAEAGSAYVKEYKITVSREVVVLDSNCDIDDISICDTANASVDLITYNPLTLNDSFNLRGTTQTLKVTVSTPVNTSKVTIKTSNETTGIDTKTRVIPVTPGQALTITVTCESEDGNNTKSYNYTANVASLDTDTTLDTLTFDGVDVLSYVGGTYIVGNSVTSINNIVATANSTYATVGTISTPLNLNVGNNSFTVRVTSEDPNVFTDYHITIVRDEDTTLSDLEAIVDGTNMIAFDGTVGPYSFTVGYEVSQMTVNYTANASSVANITVTGDGLVNLQSGTHNYEVIVQSNLNPASKTVYTITVTRTPGSTDAYIETYVTENNETINITRSEFNYSYVVPRGTTLFNPQITYSANTTYTDISTMNRVLAAGVNTKTISVTSEDGSVTNNYTFTIYVADSNSDPTNNPLIQDINVLEQYAGNPIYNYVSGSYTTDFVDYNSGTYSYNLNVPYSVSNFYLEVLTLINTVTVKMSTSSTTIGDSSFVTYVNSASTLQSLSVGTNTFYVYAISEYGVLNPAALNETTALYTITITREAPESDATLKELTVTYVKNGTPVTVTATVAQLLAQELIIENIGNDVTSVEISGTPTKASTTVSGHIGTQVLSSLTITETVTGYIFTYVVSTEAEDGSTKQYQITISRGPVDLDNDNTINYIQAYDSNGKEYLGEQGKTSGEAFTVTKKTYTYTIAYGAQSFTIAANKLNVSPAKIYIYESTQTPTVSATGSTSFTINQSLYGTTKTYIVYAQSQNGVDSDHYSITITFEAPSDNAKLNDLTADGATVNGFNPSDNGGVYTLSIRPNVTDEIVINAIVADNKSTVTGTGTFTLAVGPNSFTVTVTAQNGNINTYVINVVRDYPLPYLTGLDVVGEALLNEKDKTTVFDKDVFTYHVIVTYMTVSATIDTNVDNINYTVNCSNSTIIAQNGLNRSFMIMIAEGTNTFTISVTSQEGKKVEYKLVIQRRGLASTNTNVSSIEIEEIPQFKIDYTNLQKEYEYTVPNKINDLTVLVTPEKIADATGDGSTYQIFNASNLVSGEKNKVIILVTAEDGETTRAIVVNVTREEMKYNVNEKATEFECTKLEDNSYKINLKDEKPNAIKDYTKYIEFDAEDNLQVTVLSDVNSPNCSEVILEVSDGSKTETVKLLLESTAIGGMSFSTFANNYIHWILIIIAIIILIIILICVNRDKYGSINKKRKKSQ